MAGHPCLQVIGTLNWGTELLGPKGHVCACIVEVDTNADGLAIASYQSVEHETDTEASEFAGRVTSAQSRFVETREGIDLIGGKRTDDLVAKRARQRRSLRGRPDAVEGENRSAHRTRGL